jgi:hypothetical protein
VIDLIPRRRFSTNIAICAPSLCVLRIIAAGYDTMTATDHTTDAPTAAGRVRISTSRFLM